MIFSSPVQMYRTSGLGIGVSKMFVFYVKVLYVIGKALSGELSGQVTE